MTDAADCQAPWLSSVMWSAGALVDAIDPCAGPPAYRVVMRLSKLGYSAVFDVTVCGDHYDALRRSPYHIASNPLD
jgi:hypothetical protein